MLFTVIYSSSNTPKICRDCKFFTKKDFLTMNKFGKCSLFPKDDPEKDNMDFLVDGITPFYISNADFNDIKKIKKYKINSRNFTYDGLTFSSSVFILEEVKDEI
jgi:hypothetical protein